MENIKKVSFSECLREGILLYFGNILTIVIIDLLCIIPVWLQSYMYKTQGAGKSYSVLIAVVSFAMILVNQGALYTLFHARYKGEKMGLGGSLAAGFRLSGRVFLVSLIYALAVMSGILLLIIPGIIFIFKYYFSIIAVVVEDDGTGPMKLSSVMARGYSVLIFLTMLLLTALMIPHYFLYRFPLNNVVLSFAAFTIANLITTIFQAVQYVSYARIRAIKAAEIKPEAVKNAGTGAGCGIIAGLGALLMAIIIAISVIIVRGPGISRVARAIFGSTITLSKNVKLDMPEKWWFFGPVPSGYKSYMAFASGEKGGIPGVIIRSAGLTEKDNAVLKDGKENGALRLINELEGRMYPGRESGTMTYKWDLEKPLKISKLDINGIKWSTAAVAEQKNPDTRWKVMFLKDGDRLMYLFYRAPFDKTDDKV